MNEKTLNELLRLLINDIHPDMTRIREKRMDKLNLVFNYNEKAVEKQ